MNKCARHFVGLLVSGFMLAGIVAGPAMAQDKANAEKGKPTSKLLFNDDQVRVLEVTYKPGDESENVARPFRIVRALKSGTLQRAYPDGRIETMVIEAGEVKVYEADKPFASKNVGTSDLMFYLVLLKKPKT